MISIDFLNKPIQFLDDSETTLTLHNLLSFVSNDTSDRKWALITELGKPLTEDGLSGIETDILAKNHALSHAQFFLAALDIIAYDNKHNGYGFNESLSQELRALLSDHYGSIYRLYVARPEEAMGLLRSLQSVRDGWSRLTARPALYSERPAHHESFG